MGNVTKRIASYLSGLNAGEYKIAENVGGIVNYLLDSYFHKVDERILLSSRNSVNIPGDLASHVRETWLGCEIHKTFTLNQSYPSYFRAQTAWAFSRLLHNFVGEGGLYEITPFIDSYEFKDFVKGSFEFKTQSAMLEVSYDQFFSLPVFGTLFVTRVSDGKRLIVNIDLCYDRMGCSFVVQSSEDSKDVVEQFFADLSFSMKINDIYRNKCLTYEQGILGFQKIRETTWEDVIIKPDLRDRIRNNSVGLLNNIEQLNAIGFPANRNSLLISPPGMAKTTMFRAVSNELEGNITRIWCTGKSIQYADHVSALFEAARNLSPCIIFIEDMDLFGADRSLGGGKNHILNEFLAQLDGASSNSGLVVLASTNDFESMDEALLNRPGRFNDKIVIPYPDDEERNAMLIKFFRSYNARRGESLTAEIWKTIVDLTQGFTGDYIREVVNTAVLYATSAGRCVGNMVFVEADDLVKSGNRTLENHQIGNRAKKHIDRSFVPGQEGMKGI